MLNLEKNLFELNYFVNKGFFTLFSISSATKCPRSLDPCSKLLSIKNGSRLLGNTVYVSTKAS